MASPNIAFDSIPSSIRKPGKYVEFNSRLAVRTLPSNAQRILIVAQMMAAGLAVAGTPVQVFDASSAGTLFGRGSQAAIMVDATIKANRYAQITVLPLLDAGGSVAAAGTMTFTGPATAAGSVTIMIAGRSFDVAVANAATATAIAASVQAAIALLPDCAFTALAAVGVVTLTAKSKGTVANGVPISAVSNTTGVTAAAVQPVGGLTDPDLTTALASVFTSSLEIITWPYNNQTALTTLRTHLAARGAALEMRGAVGVYGFIGSLANATTLAGQINHERITCGFLPGSPTPAYELAAAYAAVISFEEDPARPLNNLALTPVAVPGLSSRLSRTEQEACLANGVTPMEVGPGEVVQIVRAITTYTLDPQAILDIAWLDLTTIRTMDYVRISVRTRLALRFPRDKLSARTPDRVRSEILDVLFKLEELEIVELVEDNKPGLIVERDSQDPNRLNAKIPTDVVNGLHVLAVRLDLLL